MPEQLGLADIEFLVPGSQVPGHRRRVDCLVGFHLAEADREGTDRLGRVGAHQRHHRARVDAAGQEGTHRHVGDHAQPDRLIQQALQLIHRLLRAARPGVALAGDGDRGQVPPALLLCRSAIQWQAQPGPRHQLAHSPIDRQRRRDIAVAQVGRQCIAGDGPVQEREPAQGLELRGERPLAALPAEVEGLYPDAVAGQVDGALPCIPERQGEHAGEAGQRRGQAPGLDRLQHHLGVGVTAKRHPGACQLAAQFTIVVDLAVEDQRQPAAGRRHGLVPGWRQVDDGQPAMGEAGSAIRCQPGATGIGAPVIQRPGRCVEQRGKRLAATAGECPDYTAHQAASRCASSLVYSAAVSRTFRSRVNSRLRCRAASAKAASRR